MGSVCRYCGLELANSRRGPKKEFCNTDHRVKFHAARKTEAAADTLAWMRDVRNEVGILSAELERIRARLDAAIHRLEQGVTKKVRLIARSE